MGNGDIRKSQTYHDVLHKICACFAISEEETERRVSLVWYRPGENDLQKQSPFFSTYLPDEDELQNSTCTVNVTFGAPCEIVFSHADFHDKICFPSRNGSLYLFGHAVCSRWQRDMDISKITLERCGLISVTIIGLSPMVTEESKLAPMPAPRSCILKEGGNVDPKFASLRPAMRIVTVRDAGEIQDISHDDVIIIPNFMCEEADWSMYYKLLEEVRESQAKDEKDAKWESWHEGAHLLTKNPNSSDAFHQVLDKICHYFAIANGNGHGGTSMGTRFNWYRDGSDWKPFHHDLAGYSTNRAKYQNCTVGISFGASRELAFQHAKTGELIYFPQTNGMLFFFGRDVNIRWQHGLNALPAEEQGGKGRISIILWGLTTLAVEEEGSPSMLADSSDSKGKGKGKNAEQCRNFLKGICKHGDRCRYSHGAGICKKFQYSGSCSFGDRCKYAHLVAGGA